VRGHQKATLPRRQCSNWNLLTFDRFTFCLLACFCLYLWLSPGLAGLQIPPASRQQTNFCFPTTTFSTFTKSTKVGLRDPTTLVHVVFSFVITSQTLLNTLPALLANMHSSILIAALSALSIGVLAQTSTDTVITTTTLTVISCPSTVTVSTLSLYH
jgi:hypothetical protein